MKINNPTAFYGGLTGFIFLSIFVALIVFVPYQSVLALSISVSSNESDSVFLNVKDSNYVLLSAPVWPPSGIVNGTIQLWRENHLAWNRSFSVDEGNWIIITRIPIMRGDQIAVIMPERGLHKVMLVGD